MDIFAIDEDIETGDTEGLRDAFKALFAAIPNPPDEAVLENNFQNVVYLVFMLLGKFVRTEVHRPSPQAIRHGGVRVAIQRRLR